MELNEGFLEELLGLLAEQHAALVGLIQDHRDQLQDARRELPATWPGPGAQLCAVVSRPVPLDESADPVPESPWKTGEPSQSPSPDVQAEHCSYVALKSKSSGTLKTVSFASEGSQEAMHLPVPSCRVSASISTSVKPADFHLTERSVSAAALWRRKMRSVLDFVAAGMVGLNCLLLMVELELEGRAVGARLGTVQEANDFDTLVVKFQVVDNVFIFIFTAELLARIGLDWPDGFRDVANWFDFGLILAGLADWVLMAHRRQGPSSTMRVVRALKSMRALRLLRSFRFVRGLRLLVQACQCFLPSLCWAMVLLGVFMSVGALILGNLLLDFSADEGKPMEDRLFIWDRYGTTYRAMYTLYEITLSGSWPTNVRPVLTKVSHSYVLFFLVYITIVVFAIIRVISAIFLKDTLDAAQSDAENLVVERLRKKDEYVQKLAGVFRAIDRSGDGMITEDRLSDMLSHPKVAAYFQTLDVDVQESKALFHIIDNGDGELTLDEFIDGIMRCKGQARSIDLLTVRTELRALDTKIAEVLRKLQKVQRKARVPRLAFRARLQANNKKESPWGSSRRHTDLMDP
ncbi:unnamed protein product [Effrenium voratum]|uniref:EF-hand domain-containing protein n=1 Tax=Effrenium voratum TaxID=2562239 RepID=A0AA36I7B0_9DINO|nr:unnamed protein product [Effrenium voratum]CAJ1422675.1 unnamed protein product [Effrenium voratum]